MTYPDFQSVTLLGRIANLTVIKTEDDRQCLAVTLYHRISPDAMVTIKFLNSNGLLTAYNNSNLVIGQELTVTGKLQAIRAFYMKDDVLTPLKQPEFQLRVNDYAFGSKPQPKSHDTQPIASFTEAAMVEPTLEPIPF
jgi:hypothetical protein